MVKKNKNKKSTGQQGSAQNPQKGTAQQPPQQSTPQPSAAAQNAPVQQAPQTQIALSNVAGQNPAAQQPPVQQPLPQRSAWSNVTAQNAPAQQPPPQRSAWSNVAAQNAPAQQPPQQRSSSSNVAAQNAPTQQPPPQRSAWSNVAAQNAPAQQPPQQRSSSSNVAAQNAPAQQPRSQRSAWSNVAAQNAPAQQPPPQRSAWSNVAAQNAPAQQLPPQRSAWSNVAGQQPPVQQPPVQQPPQQRSVWSNGAGQNAPVQQAPMQQAPVQQAPVQQALGQQMSALQVAGGDAPAQKAVGNRRRLEDEVTTRPTSCASKRGTMGREVMLQTNYFEVLKRADWCLYQYRVDIAPNEERTFVKKALLRVHEKVLGSYLFDGTMLFCSNRLPSDLMELQSMRDDKTPMKITIKLTGDLARGDHHYLQLFNILVRRCLEHLQLQLVGRNYFDIAARSEVREHDLELWPGYLTSIRQHDKGILMCSEVSHKVMRIDTLYDILDKLIRDCRRDGKDYQSEFMNRTLGTIALTTYNNRTYRIDDIDWEANLNTTFEKNGEKVRFADYYQSKYQIRIQDTRQPLLVSKMSQRQRRAGENEIVYLVPSLCRATGLTDKMRNNFPLMKALATHTKLSPQTRINKLMHFNQRLLSTQNVVKEFNQWDFKLDNRLVEVKGRILPQQDLLTGNNQTIRNNKCDWNFEMQGKAFFKGLPLKDWGAIIPKKAVLDAERFIDAMIASGKKMSFVINKPDIITIPDDRADIVVGAIDQLLSKKNLQLIMCMLSSNNTTKYSAIKKKVCVDRPIPSQVVLFKTLNQRSLSMLGAVSSKVAMQMGCKIGCVPWSVNIAQATQLNIMSVGFDVCHDKSKPGSDFGAMVASIDPSHGIYFSSVTNHASGEELSNDLALKLEQACLVYKNRNQRLPDAIIIYRDGVGEGQVPFVYNYELKRVVQTLDRFYTKEKKKLKLSFIIVTKRINTRLFNRMQNPQPGTIVDDVITDPLKYDFFLVSQSVREGTVSPTSYNIIYDNTGLTTDVMQLITYKLCHMYFNFTGTVRVPAACQFAHKLAFFVSQAVLQRPSERLSQLLYFI